MAWNTDTNIKPVYFGDLNAIIDEKGTQFIAMRKTQWLAEGKEKDESKAHLEIRKYLIDKDGVEKPGKGVSFLTDDGPNTLAEVLVDNNYGNTKTLLKSLKKREDFKNSVEHLYDKEEDAAEGDFFDMRSLLLSTDTEDDDIDEE